MAKDKLVKLSVPRATRLSEIFKALGEPTRVTIVALLCEHGKPLSVSEICLHLTQQDKAFSSTVSHHLKELRNAGLVLVEKQGKTKQCRLASDTFALAAAFLLPKAESNDEDISTQITAPEVIHRLHAKDGLDDE